MPTKRSLNPSSLTFFIFFIGTILVLPLLSLAGPSKAAAFSPEVSERAPLALGQGEQRLLIVPQLKRFSLGGSAVKAIRPPTNLGPSTLLLKGVAPGTADLWVWKEDGSVETRLIQVQEWTATQFSAGLRQALSGLQEIEVIPAEHGMVLRDRKIVV